MLLGPTDSGKSVFLDVMISIDELVENKIKEELGLYHTEGRRTQNRIRDRIQEELRVRPKTIHELKNALNTDRKVVEKNIEHLKDLGVVASLEKKGTTYWKLTDK